MASKKLESELEFVQSVQAKRAANESAPAKPASNTMLLRPAPDTSGSISVDEMLSRSAARAPLAQVPATAPAPAATGIVEGPATELPVHLLVDSPYQLNLHYDEHRLQGLVDAWNAGSKPDPIVVRPLSNGKFEIVAGHHRTRAARMRGDAFILGYVQRLSDHDAADRVFTSNNVSERSDYELALFFSARLKEGRFAKPIDLARHYNVDKGNLSRMLAMLQLPAPLLDLLRDHPGLFSQNTSANVIIPALTAHPDKVDLIVDCVRRLIDGLEQNQLKSLINQRLAQASAKHSEPALPTLIGSSRSKGIAVRVKDDKVTLTLGSDLNSEALLSRLRQFLENAVAEDFRKNSKDN